jgi:hypothetical protein
MSKAEAQGNARPDEFTMKKEYCEKKISGGLNIPELNSDQMRGVKEALSDLFNDELSRLLE